MKASSAVQTVSVPSVVVSCDNSSVPRRRCPSSMANCKALNVRLMATLKAYNAQFKVLVIFAVCLFCYLILNFLSDLGDIKSSQMRLHEAMIRQSGIYLQQLSLLNRTMLAYRLSLAAATSTSSNLTLSSSLLGPLPPQLAQLGPLFPILPGNSFVNGQKFITTPLSAIAGNGGLGNQLFELISLIGIGRQLGRQPVISASDGVILATISSSIFYRYPQILDQVQVRFFDRSQVAFVPFHHGCCLYSNVEQLSNRTEDIINAQGSYYQSYKYFEPIRSEVRQWLSPQRIFALRATMMLPTEMVRKFKICVHLRRGDFMSDGIHLPSDPDFTRDATEFLLNKFKKLHKRRPIVVVLGNDPIYAQYIFHDKIIHPISMNLPSINGSLYIPKRILTYKVVLTPTLSPEVDLSFSRLFCDAVVITAPSSTFGFWLAYTAKDGAKVFYRDITQTKDRVQFEMNLDDFYPKDWTKLRKKRPSTRTSAKSQSLGKANEDKDKNVKKQAARYGLHGYFGAGDKGKDKDRKKPIYPPPIIPDKSSERDGEEEEGNTLMTDIPEEMPAITLERHGSEPFNSGEKLF